MHQHTSTPTSQESIPIKRGIAVLIGYGVSVSVNHGRLCLSDGIASKRRHVRLSKATCRLKRLVILGHSGVITFQAIRWLSDIKAALVQIDADGKLVLASSPPNEGLTHLRRAQVGAISNGVGLQVMAKLLFDKITGQADLSERIGNAPASERIRGRAEEMRSCTEWSRMEPIEAQAARIYWKALSATPVQFTRRDEQRVPGHWRTLYSRRSPLSGSPRRAANPANALLNYLYAILEAETRIALLTVGLDPGLGLLHMDTRNRDSLACDVMEPIRPQVDSWLFDFLEGHFFARRDFFEKSNGTVRISNRVTRLLAETSPIWAKAIGPVAEWLAKELMRKGDLGPGRQARKRMPTPLTQNNRSAGRSAPRRRRKTPSTGPSKDTSRSCPECGKVIREGERKYCSDRCFKAYKDKVDIPRLAKSGVAKLATLRAKGADPSHGGEAARKRGKSNSRRAAQRAEWKKLGLDLEKEKERYVRDILPKLKDFSIIEIRRATGFSPRYASLIRRGLYLPHPVHYEDLFSLVFTRKKTRA